MGVRNSQKYKRTNHFVNRINFRYGIHESKEVDNFIKKLLDTAEFKDIIQKRYKGKIVQLHRYCTVKDTLIVDPKGYKLISVYPHKVDMKEELGVDYMDIQKENFDVKKEFRNKYDKLVKVENNRYFYEYSFRYSNEINDLVLDNFEKIWVLPTWLVVLLIPFIFILFFGGLDAINLVYKEITTTTNETSYFLIDMITNNINSKFIGLYLFFTLSITTIVIFLEEIKKNNVTKYKNKRSNYLLKLAFSEDVDIISKEQFEKLKLELEKNKKQLEEVKKKKQDQKEEKEKQTLEIEKKERKQLLDDFIGGLE